MLEEIKSRLAHRGIEVYVEPDQGVLRIRENGIFFESGAARPVDEDTPNVGMIARVLADVLPCYVAENGKQIKLNPLQRRAEYCDTRPPSTCEGGEDARVETVLIEGHTDPRPIKGGDWDNLDLSSARAGQVFRMMTECEPRLEALYNSSALKVLGVSGYADRRPVSQVDEENRRIDLRFMMELPKIESGGTASAVIEDVAERVGR